MVQQTVQEHSFYCNISPQNAVVLSDDPCLQHDCQNGGQCLVTPGVAGYQCSCGGQGRDF